MHGSQNRKEFAAGPGSKRDLRDAIDDSPSKPPAARSRAIESGCEPAPASAAPAGTGIGFGAERRDPF